MAREKKQEEEFDTGGWINTFADLMNLLLCFFVLLFSMSTVDEVKYEQLVASLSNSVSIFDGGEMAFGEGALIASGATQLSQLDSYTSDMGKASESEEEKDPLEEYEEAKAKQQQDKTEELYGEIMDMSEKKNIDGAIDVQMDEEGYQYVLISLSGSILFDSGSAEIRKDARQVLSKVGDILKVYNSHTIEIEGHTDSIPIHNANFENNVWLSTARATKVFEYFVDNKGLSPKSLKATGRGEYNPVADNGTEKGRARNRRVEIKIYTSE